jgi:protein-tyrosine phosphatase
MDERGDDRQLRFDAVGPGAEGATRAAGPLPGDGDRDAMPPVGHPLRLAHPVLPAAVRLWGAGRPSFPDEPPSRAAVEAGVQAWRDAGVRLVVSLIEDWEVPRRAPGLFDTLARAGLEAWRFPIVDFGVPADPAAFARLLQRVGGRLVGGAGVLVHCNAGLGRTAVVLASVLKAHGLRTDPVAELRRVYRPTAMQEPTQEAFVRSLVVRLS